MKLDEAGFKALHKREGLRLKPYLDTRGVPTIAMGNTYYLDGKKVKITDPASSSFISLACDIIFIERFTFNKRYCWMTRKLPISMIFINVGNILCNELFPEYYELYGQLYEITIFSVTLLIFFILLIEKRLKK